MSRPAKAARAKSRSRQAQAKPYHHGDLRRVLVEAALRLAAEGGADDISVREAARRAGVSPGAPFRHFASRDALMTAVAEEAQRRFHAEIAAALAEAPADDPVLQFRQLGRAYLRWALGNPAHFEIISTGRYFDHDGAQALSADNAALIAMTSRTLEQAQASGRLKPVDLKAVQIAGRALVYGFARMAIDGHLPRWGVSASEIERRGEQAIDLFLAGIVR
jgi:AcrR family transcriptional regulator